MARAPVPAASAIAAAVLAILPAPAATAGLAWSALRAQGSGPRPPARRFAAVGYDRVRRRLLVFGGKDADSGRVLGDTWSFDVDAQAWAPVSSAASPPARFSVVSGVAQARGLDSFYVSTGEGADGQFFNDVWHLNLSTLLWAPVPAAGPAPAQRYGASGGIDPLNPTHLVVTHGFASKRYSDTFAFDLRQRRWADVSQRDERLRPSPRCLHAGAVRPGSAAGAVLWGGCGSGGYGPCPASDAWSFAPSSAATSGAAFAAGVWTRLPACPSPRIHAAMAPMPGSATRFALLGGTGGLLFGGVRPAASFPVLDVAAGGWTEAAPAGSGPPALYGAAAVLAPNATAALPAGVSLAPSPDDAILLFGGDADATVWRLAGADDPAPAAACDPDDSALRVAHGLLMTVSWGVLLPLGVTIARFFRAWGPLWFRLHRTIQAAGVAIALAAFVCALLMVQVAKLSALPHAVFGVLVTLLGLQQPVNAYFRPHRQDGKPATRGRACWELGHKNAGRLACLLGLANPFQGLAYLRAGPYATALYATWLAALALFWLAMTAAGRPGSENPSALARACAACTRGARPSRLAGTEGDATDNPVATELATRPV